MKHLKQLRRFFPDLNNPPVLIFLGSAFLTLLLIVFDNLNILPLGTGDFLFLAVLTTIFSLWRPGYAFSFFIATLVLENINLAPEVLGLSLRSYQVLGGVIIISLIFRGFSRNKKIDFPKTGFSDLGLFFLVGGSFLSAFFSENLAENFKLSVILLSFFLLYLISKSFFQEKKVFFQALSAFIASSAVIVFYGIWQNIRFSQGLSHFEIMPGRPNATFTEPDWLGGFLVLLISLLCCLAYQFFQEEAKDKPATLARKISLYFLLVATFVLLIITVARSAWIGALAAIFIFLFASFTNLKIRPRQWEWKKAFRLKIFIVSSFLIAVFLVQTFALTDFKLLQRFESAGTGLQKITVSCPPGTDASSQIPEEIFEISELEKYNCRHIDLEEIEREKTLGNVIGEISRRDPNVDIRSRIYEKSREEIKKSPFLGIGWAGTEKTLGKDERGASFNSSNIFLEAWLGAGFLGILGLILFLGGFLFKAVRLFSQKKELFSKSFGLFGISSWFGILIFNLFNAGIFLGFFWIWLALMERGGDEE